MMRSVVKICLVTTALALAGCKGGAAGNNTANAAVNGGAPAANGASAAPANGAVPTNSATASDGQPLTREFLIGRWAVEHGDCSMSIDFDADVMGPPAGSTWTIAGNTLTVTHLDHTTERSTIVRTGPDGMTMTRMPDGDPLRYTRCH